MPKNTPPSILSLAESAYNAYGRHTNFRNFMGKPMPKWDELSESITGAWCAAVAQVVEDLRGGE